MKDKRLQALLVVALTLVSLAPNKVLAQAGMNENDPMAIYREAGASQDQLKKIAALAKEYEAGAQVKAQRMKNLVKRMQDYSLQPDPEPKAVEQCQDEINTTEAEMNNAHVKLMLSIRSVLSPDQKQKLVELVKQHHANAGGQAPVAPQ